MTATANSKQLLENYLEIRHKTEQLCQPLATEDYVIQGMEDVSPPKWHLAHTTWFFEYFILQIQLKNYKFFHPQFNTIFNSYYHGAGLPYPRQQRGLLSRPTVKTVYQYRKHIDEQIIPLIEKYDSKDLNSLVTLGLHHEQQHQELLLMDIKYNFSLDPDCPAYNKPQKKIKKQNLNDIKFIFCEGGIAEIGYKNSEFCYDIELPVHQKILKPYRIANRLVTNKEYLEFIKDKGYKNPRWWLSDGWFHINKENWHSPLYWKKMDDQWYEFTLQGLVNLNLDAPVSHISYYEANAFAKWKNKRLPTEEEWEHLVNTSQIQMDQNNFLETEIYHPQPSVETQDLRQFYGDVWEWTNSPYIAYPGYKPLPGILGEYNGKFMNNQMVLRGGSCITPRSHIRSTYRNFFQPDKRWQFSGIRLAEDA